MTRSRFTHSVRIGARFAGVALSVPSLDPALRSFRDAIGCPLLSDVPLDKGVLWHEPPARKRSVVLDGGSAWLEPTKYAEPAPHPWPEGYRICDHGIVNVALGFRDVAELRTAWARMQQGGFRPHGELVSSAGQIVVGYMDDPQSFNVELLMERPWLDGVMGFRRESRVDKVIKKLSMALAQDRYLCLSVRGKVCYSRATVHAIVFAPRNDGPVQARRDSKSTRLSGGSI